MLIKSDRPTHDIPPLRDPDQNFNLAYEGTEKSEILNKYFCSISNLDDANKDLPEFDDRCHDFLSQIIVSEQDVLDIVSTLDANKAVGPDIVSNRMLLAVRNEISKPLCLLFNKSLHDRVTKQLQMDGLVNVERGLWLTITATSANSVTSRKPRDAFEQERTG
ncbi:unnamed protein product [Mytilus coruscus]|uniref:Uncharacterized protein n=1 Tax=Mytilus coruscus TaxID=42192 RepID=A0A6J8A979_MYTCO|nr:unnamed protein product [Mytilus coruscus]